MINIKNFLSQLSSAPQIVPEVSARAKSAGSSKKEGRELESRLAERNKIIRELESENARLKENARQSLTTDKMNDVNVQNLINTKVAELNQEIGTYQKKTAALTAQLRQKSTEKENLEMRIKQQVRGTCTTGFAIRRIKDIFCLVNCKMSGRLPVVASKLAF